ncbi:hypothetical protein AGOR_G00151790 [Albula goreensis]|uniref:Uncharacterized protein n=1 Tax=Albula goreensis TaxID=1534307 RepID=A0A8T3D182_9TELE|nr:hypothetical protein AGOR_G00151790 [Albula goreensis]
MASKAQGPYANASMYSFKETPGVGAKAEAGVGRARRSEGRMEVEARGPNAAASAAVSLTGAEAMARAELAGASATAGPLNLKVGLGVDTGASIGPGGVEAKVLGCGFTVGPKISMSLFGNEFGFSLWSKDSK